MKTINRLFVFILLITNTLSFAQGGASSCAELEANYELYQSCATSIPFANSTGSNGENFNTTCIGGAFIGPTWFFMEIKNPGTVTLQISQTNLAGNGTDVDFVLWGPFNNLNNICNQLNTNTEVDCSWLPDAIETVNVPASNTGDLYVLLIDNYSGTAGNISVSQIGGTGSTNCDFLSTVEIKNPDNSELTQVDYCKPTVKDITAFIDTSGFSGNLSDLRFNYTWYKDNVQIGSPILDSTSAENTLQISETGTYKVVVSAYDIVNNPNQNNPVPEESESEVYIQFHTTPDITLTNTNSICLETSPILTVNINNPNDLDSSVDLLTYEWYLNNTLIIGATSNNFTPSLPGSYQAIVKNSPCSDAASNQILIYENPDISIQDNQTICEGDSYTITSANANATLNSNVTYEWYKDGSLTGITTPNYTVNSANQTPNTTSTYYVIATEEGQCTNTSNTVSITLNALPVVNSTPVDLEQCDYLNNTTDGFAETNLTQLYDYITNTTPGLTLYYYTDSGLTNLITDPEHFYNATAFNQTIYIQAINENVTPSCASSGISQINLQINPTSPSIYPDIAPVCPEVNQQYGFIDFDNQRQLIKNTFFPTSNVIISFHLNQSDASTGINELTNTSQIPIGTTTIHTKVISTGTKDCLAIGTFTVTVTIPPTINNIQNEDLCLLDSFLLNTKDVEALAGQSATVSSSYFPTFEDARDNILTNLLDKNSPLQLSQSNTTYYIRLFDSATGCFSIVDFQITTYPNPTLTTPDPIEHCGINTAEFDLTSRINQISNGNTNYQISFYATANDLANDIPIVNPSEYDSGTTTVFIKANDPTNLNCEATTTLDLIVLDLPGNTVNPTPLELCNDSGYEIFNLRIRENEMSGSTPVNDIFFKYYKDLNDAIANTNNNLINNPTQYTNSIITFEKVFVRLTSKTQIDSETNLPCFRILELDLYVRPYPENNLLDRPYTICVDQANNIVYPVEIKTGLNETDYVFVWFTGYDAISGNEISGETSNSYTTDIVGEYSVQITNISNAANCSSVFNFSTINSLIPNNFTVSPEELIAFKTESTISVMASPASADYVYSIDNFSWQESPIFTNLQPGSYSVYVTNKFGCGNLTTNFIILDYPKFFTPNNDGYNDTWNIIGTEVLDGASIHIFNRYGKFIKQISPFGEGWDGTYLGKPLPSDDYWFTIFYTKDGVSKEFKNHFTLKR